MLACWLNSLARRLNSLVRRLNSLARRDKHSTNVAGICTPTVARDHACWRVVVVVVVRLTSHLPCQFPDPSEGPAVKGLGTLGLDTEGSLGLQTEEEAKNTEATNTLDFQQTEETETRNRNI